jgi:hypothetical protein
VERRSWLRLARLTVVVVLMAGFATTVAQLLPAIPKGDPSGVSQGQDDSDLGGIVQQMAAAREAAGDQYARFNAELDSRVAELVAAWHRVAATALAMTWLERVTFVLTLAVFLFAARMAPLGFRLLRRRLLDAL